MSPLRPLRSTSSALAAVLTLAPWQASHGADEPPVVPAPVTPAAPVRALEAGAPPAANLRYQTGIEMYVRGDFAGAAREFRVGVALAPGSAKLAYNLARSLERAGDVPGAIAEYRRYLVLSPAAADRSEVERVIAVLEGERATAVPAGAAPSSASVGTAAPAGAEPALSGRELAAWGCVGGAVVAAVVGVVFTTSAVGARDDAAALGPDDTARHAALKDDYETGRLGAGLGFGLAGGAALAAGLLFWWPSSPEESGRPVASADHGTFGWAWRF